MEVAIQLSIDTKPVIFDIHTQWKSHNEGKTWDIQHERREFLTRQLKEELSKEVMNYVETFKIPPSIGVEVFSHSFASFFKITRVLLSNQSILIELSQL